MAAPGSLAPAWLAVLALVAAGLALFLLTWRAPPDLPREGDGPGRVAGRPLAALPLAALALAGAIWAVYNGALVLAFGFGPTLLTERGWSLAAASSTTSIVLWLMVVSVPLGGLMADRSGRRDTVLALGLAGFAAMLVAAVLAPLWAVPAIFVGLGLTCGISGGPILSLPSRVLRPEARALGMGVFFTFSYAALMVSPTLGGWLAERTGDAGTAFVLGAVMLASGLPALGLFRRRAALERFPPP
ncbi:MAG: MFS transporter [Geminicoccaceae bacterium]